MSTEKDVPLSVGERLRLAVDASGMSAAGFARLTGIPYRSLQQYFAGDRHPSADALARLCVASSLDINWLLTGKGSMWRNAIAAVGPADGLSFGELGPLNEDEVRLIHLFRQVEPDGQKAVVSLAAERSDVIATKTRLAALAADLESRIAELDRRGIRPEEAAADES